MRKSEFARAVEDEFGEAYGRVVTRDLVIQSLGDRTADQAIAQGESPRDVWLALCDAEGVPMGRRHGVGLPEPTD
ncbi:MULTISPECIES: DUF3046 domain-containing protein [unclassified Frigoribacterium]|jgi:hypothetical protein|uniref:DUF3046 domain-containing protein n=1 Tax=unclassified Frigoribacterium TaxID=2627005 RepID=UPI0006FE25E2|nr:MULTISPECIES: DUF3046 domain-containing protein [unclassified Frigoribacterium]KQM24030.1 signal transduction histidine kinase [Frigoribacterium sp. Leaf8]ROS50039.1 DUF3046 family protein [Frigoribacterium sp. PhB118]WAC53074.1 DUF3046 domain-containing protein [Frigoribacterium sp. SL97]